METPENSTTSIMGRFLDFMAPSGYVYTIREQNGQDDDIISNPAAAKTLRNLSEFISGIVVSTDRTPSGKLTLEEAHLLPCNDRYAILFNSRKHSLGDSVDFEYDWGKEDGGKQVYEEQVSNFLFDYSEIPSEVEMRDKPNAIPFYPNGKDCFDIPLKLSSGKELVFDLLNGETESYTANLPVEKRTKNQELVARNLRLLVTGNYEKVTNFKMFSVTDMSEIRRAIASIDPTFNGSTEISNPHTPGQKTLLSIVAVPGFFFLGEM